LPAKVLRLMDDGELDNPLPPYYFATGHPTPPVARRKRREVGKRTKAGDTFNRRRGTSTEDHSRSPPPAPRPVPRGPRS
jgi:hypothetical protein